MQEQPKVVEDLDEDDNDIKGRQPYNEIDDDISQAKHRHMMELEGRNVRLQQKEDEQKLSFIRDNRADFESSAGGSRSVNTGGGYTRASAVQDRGGSIGQNTF